MFNKKPLIIALFVCLGIAVGYSAFTVEKSSLSQEQRLRTAAISHLRNESAKKSGIPSFNEAEKAVQKLEKLKAQYAAPKELFQQLKDNYSYEAYLNITNGKKNYYSSHFASRDYKEEGVFYFNNERLVEVSMTDESFEKLFIRMKVRVKPIEYLPVRGSWEHVFFMRKISDYANTNAPISLHDMTVHDLMTGGGSSKEGSNEMYTSYSFSADSVSEVFKKFGAWEGLYAFQFHLYPDPIMAQTLDGVIKSPIYYLRVKE